MCKFMCSWYSVLYHTVRCVLVAGYLEIKLKTELVASNECRLLRKYAFMWLSTNLGKSIPTKAHQIFLFVPDSIKLGRACSSDVYSILKTKTEINLMMVNLCYSCESLIVILVHTSNSAMWPLL